ncbi:MAG: DeoR/GlpR family DNA-binding transcription regulator [Bacillota bacterium]
MFGIERRSKIMTLLDEKKSISVQETAAFFNVTEETIRRDLKVLEKQGLLIRTHGGAVVAEDTRTEAPLEVREAINIEGKDAIGRKAAQLVADGDTILLDASTSSLYVAKHIKGKKNLTVITNAERIIHELAACEEIKLISTGGIIRKKSLSCIGFAAENAIKSYHADKLFFSCKGFSPHHGLTDSNEQESSIRKLMISCSEKVVFLCDHTKFEKVGYVTTARLEDIDYFITDAALPEEWRTEIEGYGIKLEVV